MRIALLSLLLLACTDPDPCADAPPPCEGAADVCMGADACTFVEIGPDGRARVCAVARGDHGCDGG